MLTKNKRLFRFDSCLTFQNSFFFSFDIVFLLYRFRFFSLYFLFLLYRFRRFFSLDFVFLLYRFRFISLNFTVFLLYRFRFISLDFVFLLYRFRWILFSFRFVSFLFVSQFTGTHIFLQNISKLQEKSFINHELLILDPVFYSSFHVSTFIQLCHVAKLPHIRALYFIFD